jgi:acetoin utilization deacetylase AcuC-like enzyme
MAGQSGPSAVTLVSSIRANARRLLRAAAFWRRNPDVRFVFGREYSLELPGSAHDARRAHKILSSLFAERLLLRRRLQRPRAASMRALRRVHDDAYLESLQDPSSLLPILGMTLSEETHDEFLLSQRVMTGGTLLATRTAFAHRSIAVNLGGGFHHARADRGQGFCVYNDVAAAIAKRRAAGFRRPVLVIDLDLHDGDGTRTIFADDDSVHTFSIHNQDLGSREAVESTSVALGAAVGDATYLEALERELPPLLDRFRPRLVYYLAGTDPAEDDALGNWNISSRAILHRDRFVVNHVRRLPGSVPMVILLAGGYGQDSWRYSARTCALLSGGSPLEPPRTSELTLAHYRSISRYLRVSELTAERYEEGWSLSESDLLPAANAPQRSTRLLGYYSKHGIEFALERYGIFDRLRKKGFDDLVLDLELDDSAAQTVRVRTGGDRPESVAEIRLRQDARLCPGAPVLAVDWLLLQNPLADLQSSARPILPGQKYPGLGLLREVSALLILICERLELDGLAIVPSHYHIAALTAGPFRFVEPESQARFEAMREALGELKLHDAALAVEEGRVVDAASGEVVRWQPSPMIHAVSETLVRRLAEEGFEKRARSLRDELRYALAPRTI